MEQKTQNQNQMGNKGMQGGQGGMYPVDLRPGSYEVKLVTYMRVLSGPTKLTLGAGTRTVANYMLDNGIRAPVSQQ